MRFATLLAAAAALGACTGAPQESAAQVAHTDDAKVATVAASRRTAITDAVARVAPAVVTVQT
jgi:hypothetical protein